MSADHRPGEYKIEPEDEGFEKGLKFDNHEACINVYSRFFYQ